ncbi:MAG: type II toxin -antitoxin system TacA 1-like antitoxin [Vulcanimicrobiaceae bacterium]
MPSATPRRHRRLELRLTNEERALLEQAALLRTAGDLSRMVTTIAVDAARAIVREHEVTEVTDDIRKAFYSALFDTFDNPALAALFAKPAPEGYDF